MAAFTDVDSVTDVDGEDIGTDTEFYKWLTQQKAKASLIKKLIHNGYDSIDMLKAIGDDLDDVVQHLKLAVPEKINLKMILQKLSTKHSFVDPEEVKAIDKMENKLKSIQSAITLVSNTKQSIDTQVTNHTQNIQNSFEELHQLLKEKEIHLMKQLNRVATDKKDKLENIAKILSEQRIQTKQKIDSCQKWCREFIEMKEIEPRKTKIIKIAHSMDDIKIVCQYDEAIINNKIKAVFNKALLIESINSFADICGVAPVLLSLKNDKSNTVSLNWKLSDNNETKYDADTDIAAKVKVEWTDIELKSNDGNFDISDDMKQEWKYNKEFDVKSIKDNTINIEIDKKATYLFRIIYFNGKFWTNKSNIKSIQVTEIFHDDEWDKNNVGTGITINGKTISKNGDGQRSAFLTNVVSKGIHVWKFKANHLTPGNWNPLGIWKINSGTPITGEKWVKTPNNGYAYRISKKEKTNPASPTSNGSAYGVNCKTNDTIEMTVDFNTNSLSYKVNQVDFGKAFDIEATEYRAAFNCYYNGNSITLLSYNKS